jgi:hypothetical protein
MKYRLVFDQIGRNHDPAPLVVEAADADDLAEKVFTYIRKKKLLISREFDVEVDLGSMSGSIEFGRFGHFTIEQIK